MTTWQRVKLAFAVTGIVGSAVVIGGKLTHNRWVVGSIGFEREAEAAPLVAVDRAVLAEYRPPTTKTKAQALASYRRAEARRKQQIETGRFVKPPTFTGEPRPPR